MSITVFALICINSPLSGPCSVSFKDKFPDFLPMEPAPPDRPAIPRFTLPPETLAIVRRAQAYADQHPPDPPIIHPPCSYPPCTNPARYRCSRCGIVQYCGRQHQRLHRPLHRPQCTSCPYGEHICRHCKPLLICDRCMPCLHDRCNLNGFNMATHCTYALHTRE
jgi:hypothetical protein